MQVNAENGQTASRTDAAGAVAGLARPPAKKRSVPDDIPACLADLVWPDFDWGAAVEASIEAGDDQPVWAYIWRAGNALADLLVAEGGAAGARVVDLGCGHGHLGLVALASGAREVLFTDANPQSIAWIEAMLLANDFVGRGRGLVHSWGDPLPAGPWDLILGGDILYRPDLFAAMLDTVAGGLAPDGAAWFSDPRTSLEAQLPLLAADRGLSWQERRIEERRITVATVRRLA